ncbi:MAG: DNA-processing protein DprA [Chitinispirillaceae bacterium]|nr:DNA-processing protein DprA [Chitinispirillaceae bacterium]
MCISWIALSLVKGLGPATFKRIIEKYRDPEIFFEYFIDAQREGIISEEIATEIKASKNLLFKKAEEQKIVAEKKKIKIISLCEPSYPFSLKEIFAPPPLLYVKGDISVLLNYGAAVVGTRNPTLYGRKATEAITEELVESNLVVVSGLAMGIDTIAHETTLRNGGKTVAVLGSGLDNIYPKFNERLAERIAEAGCVISEFPFGTFPEAFNFPRRNRIISGCSAAVVVVEDGERSGSLITAKYALQQGREVYAVPGSIFSPQSRGTFNLIKEGAIPISSGRELAEDIRVITNRVLLKEEVKNKEEKNIRENINFTEEEIIILDILSKDKPTHIDEIAEQKGIAVPDLFVTLLNLELKGMIQQCGGQHFVKV